MKTQRQLKSAAVVDWKPADLWAPEGGQRAGEAVLLGTYGTNVTSTVVTLFLVHDFYTSFSFPILFCLKKEQEKKPNAMLQKIIFMLNGCHIYAVFFHSTRNYL